MEIIKEKNDGNLNVKVSGRLDTTTAPDMEQELEANIEGIEKLTLDLSSLEYISSAGLRVLLKTQRAMTKQNGELVVTGVNEIIGEIFEVTGFAEILTIE